MANNPYVNKVVFGSATLVDLTGTTATADKILQGYGAFGADGAWMDGTATQGGGSGDGYVWQDGNGYVHLSDEQGTQTIIDSLTVSSAGTTTAPTGHAYSPVTVPNGTAGTPTASKGTVSNHAITVTPSVTNSTGWITGSTKTGTAVTVTASELASGNKSITQNGTGIDVVGYSTVSVAVPSSGADMPIFTSDDFETCTCNKTWAECFDIVDSGRTAAYLTDGDTMVIGLTANTYDATKIYYTSLGQYTGKPEYDFIYHSNGTIEIVTPSHAAPVLTTKTITANGIYNASSDSADGYSSVTVNVSGGGGGGGEPAPKKQINFIDYDGTIVESYTKTEWQSVTSLPSNPSHTGLTAQGWNWTKAQIDAQLTAAPDGDVWVGQMYITTSGDTEIDVSFVDSTRLSPYLSCAVDGEITIDWGDNSTSTVTGTSLATRIDTQHAYVSIGDYTITIHVESGSWAFYGTSAYHFLNKNSSTSAANRVYSNCVQNVRIGVNTSLGTNALYNCCSLARVTIPNSVTSIGNSAFGNCYSLMSVTIPNSVTSIGNNVFSNCYSLMSVTIPNSVTSLGTNAVSSCYSLASMTIPNSVTSIGASAFSNSYSIASVTIPNSVTSIGNSAFYNGQSLASVTIPSGVTSLGSSAFSNCYGMAEYHIKPTTPPTLGTTGFNNIQSDCVIYVPSESLTAYQEAENWSTYASYMVGE